MGFLRQFLARKGGGGALMQEGGYCGIHAALPVHILPSQFLAGFHSNVMQKAVANFLANVVRVTPYWDLHVDARQHKLKYIRDVVGDMLEDDDTVVRTTGNSIVIESSSHEVCDDDEEHVSEEVLQVLQTAHQMSSSTRNILKLERNCTRSELMEGRGKPLPYLSTVLEVLSGVVSRRSAAVCPPLEVVQT